MLCFDVAAEVGVGFEGADSPIGTLLPPAVPEHNTTGAAFAPAEVGFGFEDAESPTGAPKDLMILNEGGDPRDGLRVAYYFDTEPGFWFTASEWAYLAFRVFPAATNVLRRSVRVRTSIPEFTCIQDPFLQPLAPNKSCSAHLFHTILVDLKHTSQGK